MKRMSGLSSALSRGGAQVAGAAQEPPASPPDMRKSDAAGKGGAAPSRAGLVAITVHAPEAVRRQLKSIAADEGRSVEDVAAEAFNLVFAKYRRPEIASRKAST